MARLYRQPQAHPGHRRRRLPRLAPDRPAARGRPRGASASTTSSPGTKRNIEHLLGNPLLRVHAPRRDLPALCGGRRDLQPRLPGLAGPLPARSGADDQDQRARRDQHAGAGQAGARRILQASTSEVYGDPEVHPQTRGLLGQRQPDRHPRLLRRGQALRRDAVLRLPPPARPRRSRSRASSTPTGRACTRPTGGWCPTSSSRR